LSAYKPIMWHIKGLLLLRTLISLGYYYTNETIQAKGQCNIFAVIHMHTVCIVIYKMWVVYVFCVLCVFKFVPLSIVQHVTIICPISLIFLLKTVYINTKEEGCCICRCSN